MLKVEDKFISNIFSIMPLPMHELGKNNISLKQSHTHTHNLKKKDLKITFTFARVVDLYNHLGF